MLQKYKDFNILISQNKRKKIKYVGMIGKFYLYYFEHSIQITHTQNSAITIKFELFCPNLCFFTIAS